jgi:hypothetical protein
MWGYAMLIAQRGGDPGREDRLRAEAVDIAHRIGMAAFR